LAELCLKDHQKLGQRIYAIWSMVANIGEVAAKSGNVKVFKWVLWNEYFDDKLLDWGDIPRRRRKWTHKNTGISR
jgi:hypothetical protein